jgi:predicted nucleotidyltransferase
MMREGFGTLAVARRSMSPEERGAVLARIAEALGRDESIRFAYGFGSFAEGRDFADVDLAVYVDPGKMGGEDLLKKELTLGASAERISKTPADVVILNTASLGLRMAAIRGRLIFSRDEPGRLLFIERTSLEYMDTAFLRRESLRDVLGGSASC